MKVLFLDIDGVLNTLQYIYDHDTDNPADQIDNRLVERLNRVVERTGCFIVISSSWRILYTQVELEGILRTCGLTEKAIIYDRTPSIPIPHCRGDEIELWLSGHEIDQFVILDDAADMGALKEHLVQTLPTEGLLDSHVEEIVSRLS